MVKSALSLNFFSFQQLFLQVKQSLFLLFNSYKKPALITTTNKPGRSLLSFKTTSLKQRKEHLLTPNILGMSNKYIKISQLWEVLF